MKHVHVSAAQALVVFLFIIIFGFLWRSASLHLVNKGSNLGKAMGFIY